MTEDLDRQKLAERKQALSEVYSIEMQLKRQQLYTTGPLERLKLKSDLEQVTQQIRGLESEIASLERKLNAISASKLNNFDEKILNVFLCHAKEDATIVREFYDWLLSSGLNVKPFFDEEDIPVGMDWNYFIQRSLREDMDLVLAFISSRSVIKEGYVNKELSVTLDIAQEKPEGTIYLIPIMLDECELPFRLKHLNAVRYYKDQESAKKRIVQAMQMRAKQRKIEL